MARDAISRQYDVQKNSITLTCEGDKGAYRPGVITFFAKNGRSIDLDKIGVLTVAGTGQKFDLGESASAKDALPKLRAALARGDKIVSVTGRVQGWSGVFPAVMRGLAKAEGTRSQLQVTGFEIAKK